MLLPEHAKCKRQASVRGCTKSTRQRFQTQDIGYLERHLTTLPHETAQEIYIGEVASDWWGKIVLVDLVEFEVEVVRDSWEFGLNMVNEDVN